MADIAQQAVRPDQVSNHVTPERKLQEVQVQFSYITCFLEVKYRRTGAKDHPGTKQLKVFRLETLKAANKTKQQLLEGKGGRGLWVEAGETK